MDVFRFDSSWWKNLSPTGGCRLFLIENRYLMLFDSNLMHDSTYFPPKSSRRSAFIPTKRKDFRSVYTGVRPASSYIKRECNLLQHVSALRFVSLSNTESEYFARDKSWGWRLLFDLLASDAMDFPPWITGSELLISPWMEWHRQVSVCVCLTSEITESAWLTHSGDNQGTASFPCFLSFLSIPSFMCTWSASRFRFRKIYTSTHPLCPHGWIQVAWRIDAMQ